MAESSQPFAPRRHGPLSLPDTLRPRVIPPPSGRTSLLGLTERDIAILRALHRNRVLTVELIEWAFFPPVGDSRAWPSSAAYRRVRQLVSAGYVSQLALPPPPGGGRLPRILVLDRIGLAAINDGTPGGHARASRGDPSGEVGYPHLRHALAVSQAWAALVAALRDTGGVLAQWIGEADLRADYDRLEDPDYPLRPPIAVLPDAYFVVRRPDGRHYAYFLEVDLGTEVLDRFRRKVRAYELYREGGFSERYGPRAFTVLVVATGSKRLANLRRATRTVVEPGNRSGYLFATVEALSPGVIASSVWRTLNGETRALL